MSRVPILFDNIAQQKNFPIVSSVLSFFLYLAVSWFILDAQAVWSPDTGAKLLQLQSLRLEDGRFLYDILYQESYLDTDLVFAELDTRFGVLGVSDRELHFRRLPLFPLVTLPFFRWIGFYGLYLLPSVAGAATNFFTLSLLKSKERQFAMWVLIAFGSPIFIYSTLFWEHTIACCLAMAAVWFSFRITSAEVIAPAYRILHWTTVGLLLSLSTYFRLELSIFSGAFLASYWLLYSRYRRYVFWSGLIYGLTMAPYGALHNYLFSQPIPDNAAYLFYPASYLKASKWQALPDLLVGPVTLESVNHGLLGWVWSLAAVIIIFLAFVFPGSSFTNRIKWIVLGITAIIASTFLFSPEPYRAAHGLLFTTPWVLLGLCRGRELWSQARRPVRVLILTTFLGLMIYTINIIGLRFGPPHGGLEWGARFAMIFYPMLALLTVWAFGPKRTLLTIPIVFTLVVVGLGFQVRGLITIHQDKQVNKQLNKVVLESPSQQIVSDIWWLRLNAAPIHGEKEIYLVDDFNSVANWIELATAHSIGDFTFVTFNETAVMQINQELKDYEVVILKEDRFIVFLIFHLEIKSIETSGGITPVCEIAI